MNGSTPQSSSFEFVDEKFEVIPQPAQIKDNINTNREGLRRNQKDQERGSIDISQEDQGYTEDDLMFISESITSLPSIFYPKIPLRSKEQIKPFNHQFYVYCRKKGINPFEYFFDEFGLIMAGAGLAGGIWRDYKEHYSGSGDNINKEQSREDKKLSADFDHAKQVAEQKDKDISEGVIK